MERILVLEAPTTTQTVMEAIITAMITARHTTTVELASPSTPLPVDRSRIATVVAVEALRPLLDVVVVAKGVSQKPSMI